MKKLAEIIKCYIIKKYLLKVEDNGVKKFRNLFTVNINWFACIFMLEPIK